MLFRSYRSKLIVYILLMMVFLSGTLLYSYRYVHQVILDEADNHLLRLKQLLNGHLNAERNELQRYATIVSQDLRLKEYMYVVTGIGGDSEPLVKLYEREFGWLPIDRQLIFNSNNQAVVGQEHSELASAVNDHLRERGDFTFYFKSKSGLEVVAVSSIHYRGSILGRVAVSRFLDLAWLEKNKRITGGDFFLIENGKVVKTTLHKKDNITLDLDQNRLTTNSIPYHVYQIDLPGNNKGISSLWFGLSEQELVSKLDIHKSFMLGQVITGIFAILLLGFGILRNFNGPLNQLMNLTRQVADGKIPALEKNKVNNEFDELSNHFADMLHALREKQEEIETTQKKLEQSAITDTLTSLYNRRYLHEIFPKLVAQSEREHLNLYATLLDLDHFKKVNDTFGHMAGDQCLIAFADHLQHESRASDYLFRLGGEEFLVLSIHKNIMEATRFADKLRIKVEKKPVHFADHLIEITVSGGVSFADKEGTPESILEQMLSRADIALYKAKNAGRNRISMSSTTSNDSDTRSQNITR